MFKSVIGLSALVVVFSVVCVAQSSTGSLEGRVQDQQGAVIPKADVTLTDASHNVVRKASTDGAGNFRFLNLEAGE